MGPVQQSCAVRFAVIFMLLPLLVGILFWDGAAQAGQFKKKKPTGVSSQDLRRPLLKPEQPWTAVGRVSIRNGSFCSGTLITPTRVLTAVHCVWNNQTRRWLSPQDVRFQAGYSRGKHLAYSKVREIVRAPGATMDRTGKLTDPAKDWAVLKLAAEISGIPNLQPIPLVPLKDLPLLKDGGEISQAGYSFDRAQLLTIVDSCRLVANRQSQGGGTIMLHDCDATFGDSGSPVMMRIDGDLRVVGINSAVWRGKGKQLGLAVRLPAGLLD